MRMAFEIDLDTLTEFEKSIEFEFEEAIASHEQEWQEARYVDNNPVFETSSLVHSVFPITPPNSCPVTPVSLIEKSFEIKEPEFGQNFVTDAPELEHYLKQTNPLQRKELKHRCQSQNEPNENPNAKKARTNNGYHTDDCEASSSVKTIQWKAYKNEVCHHLFASSLTEPVTPSLSVACDKGLTFSLVESVFICQKKNHFQISLNLEIATDGETLVKVEDVYESVICYKVHLYAVKAESPYNKINMEQSTADRSKRPYTPVRFPGGSCGRKTLTIGRLHFSETTSNNMRKKGKLNPDQRYFQLVVDIRAYTKQGNYSISSQVSEKVIVRASNPGQFENDVALWSKDKNCECVYRMGNVGINTDKAEQSLSVSGNLKLTGQIVTPSDIRLTEQLYPTNTRENLDNVSNMNLYKYRYNQQYCCQAGLDTTREDLGVLGNELKGLIPDAVTEGADVTLPDGNTVKDISLVNKDRLLMESLGAIQELSKVTKILTSRLIELETKNEILEVILKNMVSEPVNVSMPM